MLTKDDIVRLAQMARISLADDELATLQQDVSAILDYVDALKQVNTDGLLEVASVTGLENVHRVDEPETIDFRDDIFANAPAMKDGYYKVKAIL